MNGPTRRPGEPTKGELRRKAEQDARATRMAALIKKCPEQPRGRAEYRRQWRAFAGHMPFRLGVRKEGS